MPGWPTAYIVIPLGDADEAPTPAELEVVQESLEPWVTHVVRGVTANRITLELVGRLGPELEPTATRGR